MALVNLDNNLLMLIKKEKMPKESISDFISRHVCGNRSKNMWWGYVNENGKKYVLRYFMSLEIEEARKDTRIVRIHGPFEAQDELEAWNIFQKEIG